MAKLSPFANYHVFKKADRSYAPCNDMFYGPYIAATESEGIDAAWLAMTAVFDSSSNLLVPPIGWTFAVQNTTTNIVTEYQLTGGTTKDCIVKKNDGKTYTEGDAIVIDDTEINVDFGEDQNAIIDTIFGSVTSESGETASEDVLDPSLIISGDNWTPTGVYEYYPSGSSHDEAYAIGRIQVVVSQFNGKLAIAAHLSTGTSTSVWEVGETLATVYATTDNSTKETAQLIAVSASQFFAVLEGDTLSNVVIAISSATTSKAYGWLWINNSSKYGVQNNISFLEVS